MGGGVELRQRHPERRLRRSRRFANVLQHAEQPHGAREQLGDNTLMQLMQRAQEAHRQADREVSGEWASEPDHARLGSWMGAGWDGWGSWSAWSG